MTSPSPTQVAVSIPADVISYIIRFCSPSTLSALAQVSQEVNALATLGLYRHLDLSQPNPLVAFDRETATIPECTYNNQTVITPSNMQYTQTILIPAHHHTQCLAGSSFTPTTTISLPNLRLVHYEIDTLMYHWQYNCALMRSFTPGPEKLILSAKGDRGILYWTFATQCYEQIPAQVKTLILLIGDYTAADRAIKGRKTQESQAGRLRNLGSVRRLVVAGADTKHEREIRLVYTHGMPGEGGSEVIREWKSGEIEDIATLALIAKQITVSLGACKQAEILDVTKQKLIEAVGEQANEMGLGEQYDESEVEGRIAFRDIP